MIEMVRTLSSHSWRSFGQIQWLKVMESSSFKRPAAIKMKEVFGSAWGIMVVDDAQNAKVESVRLRVKKGIAERFKTVSFHDSQQVKCLPLPSEIILAKPSLFLMLRNWIDKEEE